LSVLYNGTNEQTVKEFQEAIAPLPGASGRAAAKPPYEDGSNLSSANQGVDLGVFRKSAELLLGEFELSVDGDLENTSHPFDELHLLSTAFHEPRPRTEGPWFIVSRHAIFDSDFHSRHLRGEGNVSSYHLPAPIAIIAPQNPLRLPACRVPDYMSFHAVLSAPVAAHDARWGLTELAGAFGRLTVPRGRIYRSAPPCARESAPELDEEVGVLDGE